MVGMICDREFLPQSSPCQAALGMQSFSDFKELKSLGETRLICTALTGYCQSWLIRVRACPSTAVWFSCKHTIRPKASFLLSGRKACINRTLDLWGVSGSETTPHNTSPECDQFKDQLYQTRDFPNYRNSGRGHPCPRLTAGMVDSKFCSKRCQVAALER